MRYLTPVVERALADERQMAFVAGPRQVGKTTLARELLRRAGHGDFYFNWDIEEHRRALVKDPSGFFREMLPPGRKRPLLVLDEIHKYPRWKRFLKGLYDQHGDALAILVTGSGRLDVYQRGGDSLMGRYDLYRLHPFTVGEVVADGRQEVTPPERFVERLLAGTYDKRAAEAIAAIERFTGFPEPLFAARTERLNRWRRARQSLVLREDLRDLTRIRDLGLVESLVLLLPERVGSPVSLNALARELGVAFNSVRLWLEALARLYYVFEVRPFAGRLARTLRREAKTYLFDPTTVPEPGPRFENLVALHLRKLVDLWTDLGLGDFQLSYVRDKEKREVDFLITESHRPWLLVEAKLSDPTPAAALHYYLERLRPKMGALQIVRQLERDRVASYPGSLHVLSASRALVQI